MIHPSKEQSHRITSSPRRAQNTAAPAGESSALNSNSPYKREHTPLFVELPNQIYLSESAPPKRSSLQERSVSCEIPLLPTKPEEIFLTESFMSDENDLIGTTISFGPLNNSMEDDSYSSSNSEGPFYPMSSGHRNDVLVSHRRRRYHRSSQRNWFDVELGRYFQLPLHDSSVTITSWNGYSKRSQHWKVIMRTTFILSMSLVFSSFVRDSFAFKSHISSVTNMDHENIAHDMHTVKDFSSWGLTFEDSEMGSDASFMDALESNPRKKRPVLYAANNLSTHPQSLQQDGFISRPKKLKEFVMTDDEIRKRAALLEAEHYTTMRQNYLNSDLVYLSIGVAFVGIFLISVYKRNKRICAYTVHKHST